ncbi:hypothetical protein ACFFRR_000515 [Megaselia abdita]
MLYSHSKDTTNLLRTIMTPQIGELYILELQFLSNFYWFPPRPSPSAAFYREECSICKDLLSFPTLALECGHVFHRECIQQSIMLCSRSCPNCRRPIPRALL